MSHARAVALDPLGCGLTGLQAVEASAGTGKTWNICALYLRLLLERQHRVQDILVVSFTRAATAELRMRLRRRVADVLDYLRQGEAADDFPARLVDRVLASGSTDRMALEGLLRQALEHFDEAAVFTIHGFCQRVLEDAAFGAGLPFALELTEETSALCEAVAADFWRRRVMTGTPSWLASHLARKGDTPGAWAKALAECLAKPYAQRRAPEPAAPDLERLAQCAAAACAGWHTHRPAILDCISAASGVLDGRQYKPTQVEAYARAWDDYAAAGAAAPVPDAKTLGAMAHFGRTLIARYTKKKLTPPSHPFMDLADACVDAIEATGQALAGARRALLAQLCEYGLDEVPRRLQAARAASHDSVQWACAQALCAGDNALAARLRTRYPAALVDEFQDTDPVQLRIFGTLYGGAGTTDTCAFIVGDPKQAIYAFRNADLRTYLRARDEAAALHTLTTNQRSTPDYLKAVNALFTRNAHVFDLEGLEYAPLQAGTRPRPVLSGAAAAGAALRIWRLPGGTGNRDASRLAIDATADEVAQLLVDARAGRLLHDGAALRPGHIAVLVRTNTQAVQVRDALLARGVGAVSRLRSNVFGTADAAELERVLRAVLEPTRHTLLLGAAATSLMGADAATLARWQSDDAAPAALAERFAQYRALWLRRGFAPMFRQWMLTEGIAQRVLAAADGQRRMTNLLHLAELLQQQTVDMAGPDALVRWAAQQRRSASADEMRQLRLESDENLVQVCTVHASKGLEYPIVFCPLLWAAAAASRSREFREYRQPDGTLVQDFRPDELLGPGEADALKACARTAQAQEELRLVYVALTRAVHRCYLTVRCKVGSSNQHDRLDWLASQDGVRLGQWLEGCKGLPDAQAVAQSWQALARDTAPHVAFGDLPASAGVVQLPALAAAAAPQARLAPRVPEGWRTGSFTSLSAGSEDEAAASDHDARAEVPETVPAAPVREPEADDILRFPRGAAAGECLHAILERTDFGRPQGWPALVGQVLATHLPALGEAVTGASLAPGVLRMLQEVAEAPLQPGLRLSAVAADARVSEMGFCLPARGLRPEALNRWLQARGYAVPRLDFPTLRGYLRGFIDLVFRHGERYYLLDWKSNHLGSTAADYTGPALEQAMASHAYHLQGLLYTVALHRQLRARLPGYLPERHLGGTFYLFLRGVRSNWRGADGEPAGVHFHCPDAAVIESLDQLLGADGGHPG